MDQWLKAWHSIFRSLTDGEPRAKLPEEVSEFMEADSREKQLGEGADVIIVVLTQLFSKGYTFADVMAAVVAKLDVNIHRRWKRMPDGTIHHI